MKINFYLFVLLTFLLTNLTFSQEIWINEFSYNCADSLIGVPEGDEFVEIVAPVGVARALESALRAARYQRRHSPVHDL